MQQIRKAAWMVSCPYKGDKVIPLFDHDLPWRMAVDYRRDCWPDCSAAEFTLLVDEKLFGKKA